MGRRRKYTKRYVRTVLPEQMRNKLRKQGLSTDIRPPATWPRHNGFAGVESYARREDKTVTDVLVEDCGFEPRETGFPGSHLETQELIEDYRTSEEVFNRLTERSIPAKITGIRKIMEESLTQYGTANLLRFERREHSIAFDELAEIFESLNQQYDDGTCNNYHRALCELLEHAYDSGYIDGKPPTNSAVKRVRNRFSWGRSTDADGPLMTIGQIRRMFQATRSTEEKALLVLYAASPCRTNDPRIHISDAREALVLNEYDPYIDFPSRKNGPKTGAIMAGTDVLRNLLTLRGQDPDWDGALFPSTKSSDGRHSGTWVNNQIKDIANRADVTIDGEPPVVSDLRDFYMNLQQAALSEFKSIADEAAETAGNKSGDVLADSYLRKKLKRLQFRRYAATTFAEAFPGTTVPEPISVETLMSRLDSQTPNSDPSPDAETTTNTGTTIETRLSDFDGSNRLDDSGTVTADVVADAATGFLWSGLSALNRRLTQELTDYWGVDPDASINRSRIATGVTMYLFGVVLPLAAILPQLTLG